ncbi:hypothetical protein J7W19_04105 [Streptomyces mobaraensis NBRC 13819 = DSM 40847]|uniref:LigA protein n=1 Tax=Streptomyces mobaraensis (strain ATCC 29032 / DSM 40847 / JCM 4168 / NBRC 13819 / NCIMB 11159 / IPCR 16-22) TaxID=1223523 RepID=M3AZN9_STRM1|nr:hypothetical protein [Streptomyces mobaraensis]EME99147.1 hypothetical protein H340_17844 [Streptomyces mobaraensis NBRC 13819 = DSM 40847]QTT72726.1 hypothetical protein J7W19_04105 [Streptomyces mobaraensis NBRC 13819 = DSM 40847]
MDTTNREPSILDVASAATAGPGTVADPRRERLRRRLGFAAVLACLPYLGLKLLWVCGANVGVVDRHRVSHGMWVAVNLATFAMDATAALIAHQMTRPGGPRVRGLFIVLPMWVASGLLAPIMITVPAQTAVALLGGHNPLAKPDGFLEPWVYDLVYSGFIVEGVVLLGAFAMYAHDRVGGVLNGQVRAFARRVPVGVRAVVAVVAGLLAVTAALRLAWGCGADFGLNARQISDMDKASVRPVEAVQGVLALVGAGGLTVLWRGRSEVRVRMPLAAAWVGSAAAFGWGGFIGGLGAMVGADHRPSALMAAVYVAETVAGVLALGAGLRALGHKRAVTVTGTAVPAGRLARQPRV